MTSQCRDIFLICFRMILIPSNSVFNTLSSCLKVVKSQFSPPLSSFLFWAFLLLCKAPSYALCPLRKRKLDTHISDGNKRTNKNRRKKNFPALWAWNILWKSSRTKKSNDEKKNKSSKVFFPFSVLLLWLKMCVGHTTCHLHSFAMIHHRKDSRRFYEKLSLIICDTRADGCDILNRENFSIFPLVS